MLIILDPSIDLGFVKLLEESGRREHCCSVRFQDANAFEKGRCTVAGLNLAGERLQVPDGTASSIKMVRWHRQTNLFQLLYRRKHTVRNCATLLQLGGDAREELLASRRRQSLFQHLPERRSWHSSRDKLSRFSNIRVEHSQSLDSCEMQLLTDVS